MRFTAFRILLGFAGAAIVGGGCATVPREAGFGDVEATVAERIGQRVHWNQGTASDQAVAEIVRSMLAKDLTADEAVQIALLNNRNLQATYEDLAIAQADLVAAGLLRNPVFDAEVRFVEGGGGTGFELAVVQDFIDVLYIPLRKRLADAAFEATKLRVAGAVLDLAGETRTAFYAFQASQQMLEMRRQVVRATEASYDLAKRLRAAGNTTELDLFNERALHEQSRLDLRGAEAQLLRDRESLTTLMGVWGASADWTAPGRLPVPTEPEEPAEAMERRAVERSLDLASARLEITQTARAVGIAAPFGLLPDAELGATAEREPDGEWAVGPAVSVPIPLFNQGQPAVASAQAELRRAQQLYAATAVQVRSRARAVASDVAAAREQVDYYASVVLPLRGRIVEQTQLQYNAMQLGAFQLLTAKQQQIDAGAAYVNALHDYWVARAELDLLLNGRIASFERAGVSGRMPTAAGSGRQGDH
jgi:cobalt-zinc-cadmium efflux system outer membrane protein